MPVPLPRRRFLTQSGTLLAGVVLAPQPHNLLAACDAPPMPDRVPLKAVSSANGLATVEKAYELLTQGADPLDAAIEGVTLVENDPEEVTVGYGGLPNENGVVELDAAVMHGPTHRAGAVASLQKIRNPARLARLVMDQTDHVLLVGEGALQFARANGFPEENLLTEKARKIWLYWKQTHSDRDDWLPPDPATLDPAVREFFHLGDDHGPGPAALKYQRSEAVDRPTGTIHCACINAAGDISCTTTTSGLAFKMPGRVGDSPIIGSRAVRRQRDRLLHAQPAARANLQNMSSMAAVELRAAHVAAGGGAGSAARVARHTTEKHLLGEDGRPNFGLKFYLLNKRRARRRVSMWGPAQFAVCDEHGPRLEECAFLYEKPA